MGLVFEAVMLKQGKPMQTQHSQSITANTQLNNPRLVCVMVRKKRKMCRIWDQFIKGSVEC